MSVLMKRAQPIKDYDLPSTIVIYVLVCLLGIGMCFCLRRANRLLPNQLSFPLQPGTNARRGRGYDRTDEELGDPESRRGLLSEQEEDEDEEEEGWAARRRQHASQRPSYDTEPVDDDNEPFGDLQSAAAAIDATNADDSQRTPIFNIVNDDEDDDADDTGDIRRSKHNGDSPSSQ